MKALHKGVGTGIAALFGGHYYHLYGAIKVFQFGACLSTASLALITGAVVLERLRAQRPTTVFSATDDDSNADVEMQPMLSKSKNSSSSNSTGFASSSSRSSSSSGSSSGAKESSITSSRSSVTSSSSSVTALAEAAVAPSSGVMKRLHAVIS
jgi:cytoskeletal protein RodZ